MVSHATNSFHALGVDDPRVLTIISYGRLGVDLFFAISGFLICTRLLGEHFQTGSISLADFYYRRAFRILPLYCFYLFVLVLLGNFAGVPVSAGALKSCLLFYRNYVSPEQGAYTNHFWSLSVEEHFYLLWPLFLLSSSPRRALVLTPVLALMVHVWRATDARLHIVQSFLPDAGSLWRTDTRIDALLWGCFAALVCFGRPLCCPAYLPYFILLALVGILTFHFPLIALLLAVLFPALLVSTIYSPGSNLSRCLENPCIKFFGRLSYSLYIWQTLFLQTGQSPDPVWLQPLKKLPYNLCCIFLLSVASHVLLEQPFIRFGRYVAVRKKKCLTGVECPVSQGSG